jgi:hypothetical protein
MAMSVRAALSSSGLAAFLQSYLGAQSSPYTEGPQIVAHPGQGSPYDGSSLSPIDWIKAGSFAEDMATRYVNHFYTLDVASVPKAVYGLTDHSEFPYFAPPGIDSFSWASVRSNVMQSTGDVNIEDWQNARDYEMAAFTNSTKSAREDNLAHMLYALGNVIHLNQDLSQPEHTRNDEHSSKQHIEVHGEKNYLSHSNWFPLQPHGWSYWKSAGFRKLKDFWDRDLYSGASNALDDDSAGVTGKQLGLAEFSNGNFLGEDAKYKELILASETSMHLFPLPSLLTSTDFPQLSNSIAANIDNLTYPDGTVAKSIYVRKLHDGISLNHHSRLTFFGAMVSRNGGVTRVVDTSINDSNVLSDYHAVLIPKAVEYSAGILDYYFRGQISVNWYTTNGEENIYTVIHNTSGESLYGGQFSLYADSSNGVRQFVTGFSPFQASWGSGTEMPANGSMVFRFCPPATNVTQYILVYQGTIGITISSPLDPVDANIAIAATTFKAFPPPLFKFVVAYKDHVGFNGFIYPFTNKYLHASYSETVTYYDPSGNSLFTDGPYTQDQDIDRFTGEITTSGDEVSKIDFFAAYFEGQTSGSNWLVQESYFRFTNGAPGPNAVVSVLETSLSDQYTMGQLDSDINTFITAVNPDDIPWYKLKTVGFTGPDHEADIPMSDWWSEPERYLPNEAKYAVYLRDDLWDVPSLHATAWSIYIPSLWAGLGAAGQPPVVPPPFDGGAQNEPSFYIKMVGYVQTVGPYTLTTKKVDYDLNLGSQNCTNGTGTCGNTFSIWPGSIILGTNLYIMLGTNAQCNGSQ